MQPRTEITHRATSAAWRILNMVEQQRQQHTEKIEADSKLLASASARKSRLLDNIAEIIEGEFQNGNQSNGPARLGPRASEETQGRARRRR